MNKATRILVAYQLKQVLPGIIIAVIAVLIILWFYWGGLLFTIYDEMGKPSWRQVGTVTNIIVRSVSRGSPDPAALVSVQVGNKEAFVNTHTPLHIGQKMSVDCRIGRSGHFYIDDFVPIVVTK